MIQFPKFFKSLGYAFQGIGMLLKENNFRIHLLIFGFGILFGCFFEIDTTEWLFVILGNGLAIASEGFNSAIEAIVDLASPEFHPLAKKAKDIAAGSVWITAMASMICHIIIFLPKIIDWILGL
ncbi:diacylglycerol kinase family protein [Flectobacillus major]|uniref:diacylglycerol kinase family protein n=1 Tax=Flectobacillus major TaxID=103 RepID=UPI00040CE27F|nr:diacylglycerol kinase family protein [Flectobacillus major]